MPPETAEQAANRVADRAMAGKHNNAQRSQASPGADSVQERVVQRQVDTVEVIHRSSWNMNSRKSISTILNILPYRAGAMPHLAAPMDRMLPQDVVGLDKDSLS